jgi:hypothetical protein
MAVNHKSNLPFAIFNFDAQINILLILTFLSKNCKTTISFPVLALLEVLVPYSQNFISS